MKISSIKVHNYRNLVDQTVELIDGLNVFVGNNAQGKTNLLECVYLCCLGKSARTDHDKDLINWNQPNAKVEITYTSRSGERQISMALSKEKKTASINGVPMAKIGELLGYMNCVYFSPDEIRVITQSPAERRRFLDIDLCQLDKTYFHSLVRFNKVLSQRNNLLKTTNSLSELRDMLVGWDSLIAREGAKIVQKRKQFCDGLTPKAQQMHEYLTKGEQLLLQYQTNVSGNTLEELQQDYAQKLDENLAKDFAMRYTTFGCQRDDIKFSVDGIDIRSFGSQGQQRTTALSLKLAELELFHDMTDDYPILLLDDVLSELDRRRQKALLSYNTNVQIIITTTKVESALIKELTHRKFYIKNGKATVK